MGFSAMIKVEYNGIKIECETVEQATELLKVIATFPKPEPIPYFVPATSPYLPYPQYPTGPTWSWPEFACACYGFGGGCRQ